MGRDSRKGRHTRATWSASLAASSKKRDADDPNDGVAVLVFSIDADLVMIRHPDQVAFQTFTSENRSHTRINDLNHRVEELGWGRGGVRPEEGRESWSGRAARNDRARRNQLLPHRIDFEIEPLQRMYSQ